MASTDDIELPLLAQDTDQYDIDLRSVANDHEETRLSLFPQFYVIEFDQQVRMAGIEKSVRFSCVVVKLPDAEAKQKLSTCLAHTKLTLDESRQVIKAENSDPHVNEESYNKWTQDVVSEIFGQGLGVHRYGIVHVGLKAGEVKQQIEREVPAVSCELNEEYLTLLFYSKTSGVVRQALELAEKAKPSNDLSSEFVTPNGIKVSLYKEDITTVPTDGVISAVDELISCSGGVSKAIQDAVGPEMRKECDDFLKTNKTLSETEVLPTTGEPKWRTVLHARGPRWGDYTEEDCSKQLTQTVYNCFIKANELGLTSLSVPFISARTFQVPPEVCAESYKRAIDMLDTDAAKSNTTLKKILFVDTSEERVAHVQRSMSKNESLISHF